MNINRIKEIFLEDMYDADPAVSPNKKWLLGNPTRHKQMPSFHPYFDGSPLLPVQYGVDSIEDAKKYIDRIRNNEHYKNESPEKFDIRVFFGKDDLAEVIPYSA